MPYFGRITGEMNIRADRLGRLLPTGRIPCAVIPIVAAVVVYAGTFGHDFAFDDVHLIPGNDLICGDFDPARIFRSNYWEGTDVGGVAGEHGVGSAYRPVTILSHAALCAVAGPGPLAPHAFNLGLHVLNVLLVFLLASRLLEAVGMASNRAATAAATVFAVHPLNGEVVLLAVGRSDLLATAAVLVVAVVASSSRMRGRAVLSAVVVFIVTLLGMMSKESAVFAPVAAGLVFWACARGDTGWRRFASGVLLPSVAAIAVYVAIRTQVLGAAYDATKYSFLDNPLSAADYSVRFFTGMGVVAGYVWRFLSPIHLSADYSYAQVPPVDSPADAPVVAGIAVLLAMVALSVAAWRKAPLATLGFGWFVASWLPVSNIPYPIGTVMAERLCYLPCIGLLFPAVAAWRLWRRDARTVGGDIAVAVFLVAVLGGITVARAHDFKDNCTLFEATAASSPDSAKAHYGHGICLLDDDERLGEAVSAFDRALKLYPDYEAAAVQLAQVLERTGHPGDGLVYLKSFSASHPASFAAPLALAKMLARQGRPDDARRVLRALVARRPNDPRVLEALGNL